MNGVLKPLKPGDMMMSDTDWISLHYHLRPGSARPNLSKNQASSLRGLCPAHVPATAVDEQLDSVLKNVMLFASEAEMELLHVYTAGP